MKSHTIMQLLSAILILNGCLIRQPDIIIQDPKVITLDIDARDYNEISKRVYDSLVNSSRIVRGKVVSLGPVAVALDGNYRFDPRTLQEKIQTAGMRGGVLEFNFAVDAITQNTAAIERYNIMRLQWEKENTVNQEDLRTFGSLAQVDYILFGRVSSHSVRKGKDVEVTYVYNWKLGDCASGLLVWTDEFEITKASRR